MKNYKSNISKEFNDQLLKQANLDHIQKLVVGALIVKSNKILILRRCVNEFMPGLIELPSGSVEPDEELLDALEREIKEETNLDMISVDGFINHFDYTSGSGKKTRQLNFKVAVNPNMDITINPDEHDWFQWIDINENSLKGFNISEQTKDVILSLQAI